MKITRPDKIMDAEHYIVEHWDKGGIWTHLSKARHQKRLKKCASYLEGSRFLEVGCAFGHSTNYLKTFRPGDWTGIDFSETAIRRARELFPDIRFYYSKDFNFFPICGKFDSVICSEVIEHVIDEKGLVLELIRVTEKLLVLTTPLKKVSDPGHIRVYNEVALSELFEPYNVEIERDYPLFYLILRR